MADDTIPQDDSRPLTEDERWLRAADWSDYRKDYGVSADPVALAREHRLFCAGWHMARAGATLKPHDSGSAS